MNMTRSRFLHKKRGVFLWVLNANKRERLDEQEEDSPLKENFILRLISRFLHMSVEKETLERRISQ